MTVRGRPGYDYDTLVAVCVEQFNQHGYEATSMAMLAEALGLSKAAIYHHVRGKEELLERAVDRALRGLEDVVAGCRAMPESPGARVRALVRATTELLVAELPNVTLLLRLRGNTPSEQHAMERRRAITHDVEALVADAQAAGEVRDDVSARLLARLLLGQINSAVEWYRPGGALAAVDVIDGVTRVVTDSLAPQRA